jgi:hypothetical protein
MRRYEFQTPVRCFVAVRPGDRISISGLAGTFLRIGIAGLLVRALLAAAGILALLVFAAILSIV